MSVAPVNRDRIRIDGGVIVAYKDGGHRILTDGVVVVEGNEIVHVGKTFDGQADRVIDARNAIVTPGLINTHTHLTESPLDKSFIEDQGRRQFYYSGLFEMLPARSAGIDDDGPAGVGRTLPRRPEPKPVHDDRTMERAPCVLPALGDGLGRCIGECLEERIGLRVWDVGGELDFSARGPLLEAARDELEKARAERLDLVAGRSHGDPHEAHAGPSNGNIARVAHVSSERSSRSVSSVARQRIGSCGPRPARSSR